MEIIELPIKALKPYKRNPRKNDKAVEYVANSIRQFGFKVPIVIDENYEIVCGHTRWKAAKVIGLESVPCIMADDLNEDQIRAFRLADNKTAEMADWDFDLLEMEFNDIDPELFDMSDFGFFQDDETEDKAPTEVTEDDFDETAVTESVCKRGQVWKLGEHRLMCGDSTNADDVALLMNGEKADMVFTDPPYNIDFHGTLSCTSKNGEIVTMKDGYINANSSYEAIRNDKKTKEEYKNFICSALDAIKRFCKGAFYICFSSSTLDELLVPLSELGMKWKSIIVYNKNQSPIGGGDFRKKYEPICYGYFDHSFYGKPYAEDDVWDIQRTLKNDLHPTMKPVALVAKAIQYSSKDMQIVLDLFGGSGTTLIASEQTGRQCRMMELDPHYCDVIIRRWENLTGQKAELLEE